MSAPSLTLLNSKLKIASYDGGHAEGPYEVENALVTPLYNEIHCSKMGVNFNLLLESEEALTITHFVVHKAPMCTAPIESGALHVYDQKPTEELLQQWVDLDLPETTEGDSPNLFFKIPPTERYTAVKLKTWLTGNFFHVKFIKPVDDENIDIAFVGLIGFPASSAPATHVDLEIPEELAVLDPPIRSWNLIDSAWEDLLQEHAVVCLFSEDPALVEPAKTVAAEEFAKFPPKKTGQEKEGEKSFVFIHCPPESSFFVHYLDLFGFPANSLTAFELGNNKAYLCPAPESAEGIRSFLESIRNGNGPCFKKSQQRTPDDRNEGQPSETSDTPMQQDEPVQPRKAQNGSSPLNSQTEDDELDNSDTEYTEESAIDATPNPGLYKGNGGRGGGKLGDTIDSYSFFREPDHPNLYRVTVSNFQELVLDSGKFFLVDVWAEWCGPCVALTPIIELLGDIFASHSNIGIGKFDCDANSMLEEYFPEPGIPNIKLFKAGSKEPVAYAGDRSVDSFLEFFHQHVDPKFDLEATKAAAKPKMQLMEAKMNAEDMKEVLQKFEGYDLGVLDEIETAKWKEDAAYIECFALSEENAQEFLEFAEKFRESVALKKLEADLDKKNLKSVIKVHSEEEYDKFLESCKEEGKLVVVDFFATWCGPCVYISPFFADLSEEFPNVIFLKVDVDDLSEVSQKEGIKAMPTFKLYKGGEVVERFSGASIEKLKNLVQTHQ